MNYSELVTAIQSYTENQFPDVYLADGSVETSTTQINRLIEQAEQRIYNTVQFPSIRKNQYSAITANNKYISLPNDFLSVYSLALVTGVSPTAVYRHFVDLEHLKAAVGKASRETLGKMMLDALKTAPTSKTAKDFSPLRPALPAS